MPTLSIIVLHALAKQKRPNFLTRFMHLCIALNPNPPQLLTHPFPLIMSLTTEQIKEAFSLFDADGSGAIDVAELTLAMKGLGFALPPAEIEEMVKNIDKDSNELIEFDEFETMVRGKMLSRDSDAEVLHAFKLFDLDKSGMLRIMYSVEMT